MRLGMSLNMLQLCNCYMRAAYNTCKAAACSAIFAALVVRLAERATKSGCCCGRCSSAHAHAHARAHAHTSNLMFASSACVVAPCLKQWQLILTLRQQKSWRPLHHRWLLQLQKLLHLVVSRMTLQHEQQLCRKDTGHHSAAQERQHTYEQLHGHSW